MLYNVYNVMFYVECNNSNANLQPFNTNVISFVVFLWRITRVYSFIFVNIFRSQLNVLPEKHRKGNVCFYFIYLHFHSPSHFLASYMCSKKSNRAFQLAHSLLVSNSLQCLHA